MKKKILLVDDDPGVRRMLQRVLEEEDYAVIAAANGLEALEVGDDTAPGPGAAGPEPARAERMGDLRAAFHRLSAAAGDHHYRAAKPAFPRAGFRGGRTHGEAAGFAQVAAHDSRFAGGTREARLARMAGERAEFHYLPPKRRAAAK